MDGNSPWGGQNPPSPPSSAQPPQIQQSFGPPQPPPWQQPVAGRPRRRLWLPVGVGLAVLLSSAALVVSLVKGDGASSSSRIPPTAQTKAVPIQVFSDDADRELCRAMGPLMNESNADGNAFQNSGEQNTPERKAAIPKYIDETYDWAGRAQAILNQHSDPPRFLVRNFQRYIDDVLLYAEGLAPDRDSSAYETQIYELSIKDLAGLIGRCSEVNAPWWN